MTLLMFGHEEDGFYVVTDTLATLAEGRPFTFQTKCHPLPHMDLVIAGTGSGNLVERWYHAAHSAVIALDITMLDQHAPEALRYLWQELTAEAESDGRPSGTVTIYHLGIDRQTGQYLRYTYRSERDFESERSEETGFGIKPVPTFPWEQPSSFEEIVALAEATRAEQDEKPLAERVHIGGDLILTSLSQGGLSQQRIHRFGDFDEMWLAMNDALARSRNDE